MNTRGAVVVEWDLAQFVLTKLIWKNYWSFFRISLDINCPPIELRICAKSKAIIDKGPPL